LLPIGQNDTLATQKRDMSSGSEAIARLEAGVTLPEAKSELRARRPAREYPETNTKVTLGALALKQDMVGDVGSTPLLLAEAVTLVLLIASANVGDLFLARSLSRSHEFAIRSTLGAGRGRLLPQLLSESLLLSVAGGTVGLRSVAIRVAWAVIGIVAAIKLQSLDENFNSASSCGVRPASLYGISPADPITFIAVVVALCAVSFLAIYVPARRAARIDPLIALRYE
jgi:ABC-type antimicrobial peptide transport system permease subunit